MATAHEPREKERWQLVTPGPTQIQSRAGDIATVLAVSHDEYRRPDSVGYQWASGRRGVMKATEFTERFQLVEKVR